MTLAQIDFVFPFFVFFYGILILFVVENKALTRIGRARLSEQFSQLTAHKPLAWLCFWVGGIWSLQNILF